MKRKILPDTSFLISCVEFKIDWQKEFRRILDENLEIIILDKILKEINVVIDKGGRQGRYAKLTKEILKKKKYKIKKSEKGHTDNILLGLSDKYLIATQDTGLKKRLKAKKRQLITIRQKKYLKLV